MSVDIIASFLPWILFSVIPVHNRGQLIFTLLFLLIFAILTSFKQLKKAFILPWATVIFFALMSIIIIVLKQYWVTHYLGVLANFVLWVIASGSLVVNKPFTAQYAREQVSKDKWQTDTFIFINKKLTLILSLFFTFSLVVSVLRLFLPQFNHWIFQSLQWSSMLVAIWLCVWFPKWYRRSRRKYESISN